MVGQISSEGGQLLGGKGGRVKACKLPEGERLDLPEVGVIDQVGEVPVQNAGCSKDVQKLLEGLSQIESTRTNVLLHRLLFAQFLLDKLVLARTQEVLVADFS